MSDLLTLAMERLVGTWTGEGSGSYPDIAPFEYIELTTVARAPDWNMLHVLQQTWQHAGDRVKGKALHLEAGLIIPRPDGELLYNCGQDSGRVEVMTGRPTVTADGTVQIVWRTIAHANDSRLIELGRTWWIDDAAFRYTAHIATVRTPVYRKHLEGRLRRA